MNQNDNVEYDVSEEIDVEVTHVEAFQSAEIPLDMIMAFELKLKEKKFALPNDGAIKLPFTIRMLAQAFENDLMLTYHKPIQAYLEFNLFTNEKYTIDIDEGDCLSVPNMGGLVTVQRRPAIRTIIKASENSNSVIVNDVKYTFEDIDWGNEITYVTDSLPADFIIAAIRQLVFKNH